MRFLTLLMLLALKAQAGSWELVGVGDCPGPQVTGTMGEQPDHELCTPALAGKTALCFTQVCHPGCQYIDVPTPNCQGGGEMAQVYTCRPTPLRTSSGTH